MPESSHPVPNSLALAPAYKHNLTLLSDVDRLRALGVPAFTRGLLLASIPRTERVTLDNAEHLWRERRRLFFKPCSGFGSRAAYRSDKLTHRVWQEILVGNLWRRHWYPPASA